MTCRSVRHGWKYYSLTYYKKKILLADRKINDLWLIIIMSSFSKKNHVIFFKEIEEVCTPTVINKKAQKGESKFNVTSKTIQLPRKRWMHKNSSFYVVSERSWVRVIDKTLRDTIHWADIVESERRESKRKPVILYNKALFSSSKNQKVFRIYCHIESFDTCTKH